MLLLAPGVNGRREGAAGGDKDRQHFVEGSFRLRKKDFYNKTPSHNTGHRTGLRLCINIEYIAPTAAAVRARPTAAAAGVRRRARQQRRDGRRRWRGGGGRRRR